MDNVEKSSIPGTIHPTRPTCFSFKYTNHPRNHTHSTLQTMPIVSTLVQRANTWLLPRLQNIIHLYSTVLIPHLRQRKAFIVPLVAVASMTLALYRFYRKISRPPASLSHLPYCDFWTTIKYYMGDGLVQDYSRQVILPTLTAGSGVFAVRNTSCVHV